MIKENALIKISNEEYFNSEYYNYSFIKYLQESPLAFWYAKEHEGVPSPAMALGTLLHCYILEPDRFDSDYKEAPEIDKRTKEYKEFASQNSDKILFKRSEVDPILEAINNNKIKDIVSDCIKESAVFWIYNDDIGLKAKIDAYDKKNNILYDIKTTQDPTPSFFTRHVINMGYHLQLAHYRNALNACGEVVDECRIIAIQTVAPYDVVEYIVSPEVIAEGSRIIDNLYAKLENVILFEDRSGCSNGKPIMLELPKWYSFDN